MNAKATIADVQCRQQRLAVLLRTGAAERVRLPRRSFRALGKDRLGYVDPAAGLVAGGVDEAACSARFVVSTATQDRDGDVLVPQGCQLDNYRRNPIWFWDHQLEPLPIGTAEDPETKQLAVAVTPERVEATIWFDQGSEFAMEIYRLVAAKLLRATSVGFTPLEIERIKSETTRPANSPWHGYYIPLWGLDEISVVGVGSQPDALATELGKGYSPRLRKALAPWAARPKGFLRGGIVLPSATKPRPAPAPDLVRWNKSLSKSFDVTAERLPPSTTIYDWVARHIGCKVKEIFQTGTSVPSARLGSFLTGLKHVLAGCDLADVRNLSGRSESPPVYEVIQLNSERRDDFLIEGTAFYAGSRKFVVDLAPSYYGLRVTVYTAAAEKDFNRKLIDDTWAWAKANNFLRGEAFALSGEFLSRTSEGWDDVFLEEKNKKSLRRTIDLLNEKGKAFANRGVILTGPPGTGKTLSGRIVRNQASATFIWVSSRDFHHSGSFGGISFGFELAKELAPAVLFMEDVDNWLYDTTVDLIKTEMDGIARSSGVLTVLTTNFPERLPEALVDRPGRFHDVLHFALPTADARKQMLAKWLPGLPAAQIARAVQATDGYSGAHCYELANFAKVLHEHDGLPEQQALEQALKKIEEQRDLITQVQLQGSHYRPKKRTGGRRPPLRTTKRAKAMADDVTTDTDAQGTDVQAVLVPMADPFTDAQAAAGWVEAQGYDTSQVEEKPAGDDGTPGLWVFTQFPADELVEDTARVEDLEDGVQAVVGQRRTETPPTAPEPEAPMATSATSWLKAWAAKAAEGMDEEEAGDGEEPEAAKSMRPGAAFIKGLCGFVKAAEPMLENPKILKLCDTVHKHAKQAAHAEYPEHDLGYGLKADDPTQAAEDAAGDDDGEKDDELSDEDQKVLTSLHARVEGLSRRLQTSLGQAD